MMDGAVANAYAPAEIEGSNTRGIENKGSGTW